MLSRIADSLFWMTRYVERTDGILRMLKINFITALDSQGSGQTAFSWQPVLKIFTSLNDEAIEKLCYNSDDVLAFMITNRTNHNSIRNIVARARENARGMQDHITKEVWECINEFYHKINSPDIEKALDRDEQIDILSDLINHCLLYYGVAEVTMPRGQGWNYMNLGKFVERSVQTLDILDVKFSNIDYSLDNPLDVPYWRNLLLSLSGYELYLKQYRGGLDSKNVADLAILNTDFPRSALYCVLRMDRITQGLGQYNDDNSRELQKLVGRLRSKVEYADMESISKMGLHAFLKEIKQDIYGFSNALSKKYFAYN